MKRERMVSLVFRVVSVGMLIGLAACAKNPPTTTAKVVPTPAPAPAVEVAPRVTPVPSYTEPDIMAQDIRSLNEKGYLKDAFFDYDKADLRDDARSALAGDADWLKKYPRVQFLAEGHCDERGTGAYNLALGDRRASAVREYLVSLGIDAARMKTISYGKEKPFCTQSNEDCWQHNRRGHFLIMAK